MQLISEIITTVSVQNVAGGDGDTGFFFLGTWAEHPESKFQYIRPGWTVVGHPDWIVTAVNPSSQTITITGGTFISGGAYTFTGPTGLQLLDGMQLLRADNSFTLSSSDFTTFYTGYGAEADNTALSIGGDYGASQALWQIVLSANTGGNAAKSSEIKSYFESRGLSIGTASYMFDVEWGPGTSTNTTRNVAVIRFDYNNEDSTVILIGTVDTNNAGWDTPGQDPYSAVRAANGTFYLPAKFTLITPVIEDANDWC